jgi:geranylgeranyl diphosphate synthase type II
MDIEFLFKQRKDSFESFLQDVIYGEIRKLFHPTLAEASIYSLSAGGKRFRPVLAISAYTVGRSEENLKNVHYIGTALECIHTYSLIHDDLPSMDNDDFRRGIPTCHKKFSESTAILAGDALNSYGFFLCSKISSNGDESIISDLLNILHNGAGGPGMVSGQIEDLENESKHNQFSEEKLKSIHSKKTGALIIASLLMGNRLRPDYQSLKEYFLKYGEDLGMLFQITDDIIDEEGTFSELGKTPGKDSKSGKLTYPALYGMEESKRKKNRLKESLQEDASKLANDPFFFYLPDYIANRKN